MAGALMAIAGGSGPESASSASGVKVFWVCVVLAYGINWLALIPSYLRSTERFFDLTGSVTYLTVVFVALLLANEITARSVVLVVLVTVWAGRLGTFLFRRVVAAGSDGRFDEIKTDAAQSFMTWTLQGLWVVMTAGAALAAIVSASSSDGAGIDAWLVAGLGVWLVGFAIEVVADRQKSAFKSDGAHRDRFITTGLWAWSRHPNYFGEIVLWVGIAVIAFPVLSGWRLVTLVSPVFVYLLLTRVSGLPMLEARAGKRWGDDPDYQSYQARTPVLVPRPPRV
jgi:steroid 5-alpha reductase family enzyme